MAQAQHDQLTRDERNRLSPEQWKANHARNDAQNLKNPPPSLAGFLPDKPPPPRLEAQPGGKMPAYVAHAPLKQSLGDKLRAALPGSVTKVNPLVVVTPEREEKPVETANDTPVTPPVEQREPKVKRSYTKPRVVLEAHERREAIIDSLSMGLERAAEKWKIDPNSIYSWRRAARFVADGFAPDKTAQILGVNTHGSTKESAQAIFAAAIPVADSAAHGIKLPASIAKTEAEPPKAEENPPDPPKPLPSREELKAALQEAITQLEERASTLAGYKIELEKLRLENELLKKHNDTLRAVSEALAAKGKR